MSLYQLEQVGHTYGEQRILKAINLTITAGEIFALVGPSGAGKSTLLRLMALLEAPSQGRLQINLNDKSLTYHKASITDRRQLGMVFQRPTMLTRSVYANVAFGLHLRGQHGVQSQVKQILEAVALQHLAQRRVHSLSGGELQRVALARALILQPKVLLLDEPTANLDPYNIGIIENLVRHHHDEDRTTVIIVTHNVFQAKRLADRVGLLLEGELIEVADTDTFFNHPQDPRTQAFLSGDLIY